MSHYEVAELVAQLGRAVYAPGVDGSLTSAQWAALHYFSWANHFSRTVSAFAAYHGTTRGTASQTVKRLEECGYVSRSRSKRDGRSWTIDVTGKAEALLRHDPFNALVRAIGAVPADTRESLMEALGSVFQALVEEGSSDRFGICLSCRSLQDSPACEGSPHRWWCKRFNEAVEQGDLEQLCGNFEPIGSP